MGEWVGKAVRFEAGRLFLVRFGGARWCAASWCRGWGLRVRVPPPRDPAYLLPQPRLISFPGPRGVDDGLRNGCWSPGSQNFLATARCVIFSFKQPHLWDQGLILTSFFKSLIFKKSEFYLIFGGVQRFSGPLPKLVFRTWLELVSPWLSDKKEEGVKLAARVAAFCFRSPVVSRKGAGVDKTSISFSGKMAQSELAMFPRLFTICFSLLGGARTLVSSVSFLGSKMHASGWRLSWIRFAFV